MLQIRYCGAIVATLLITTGLWGCGDTNRTALAPSSKKSWEALVKELLAQKVDDEYVYLDHTSSFKCWARVASITYEFEGKPDGKLVSFDCLDEAGKTVELPLASDQLKDGEIDTKQFGVIKMKVDGSGQAGTGYFTGKQSLNSINGQGLDFKQATYYLKPSQTLAIKTFLGWHSTAAPLNVNSTDAQGNTALMIAASKGSLTDLNTLIAAHADVNIRNNEGDTALLVADGKDELEIIKALLAAHADVNVENGGYTPLSRVGRNPERIRVLVAAGATPNGSAGSNITPLLDVCGASTDESENVKALIAAHADVNLGAMKSGLYPLGITPLMEACSMGQLASVKVLIAAGANVNARTAEGSSVLECAKDHPEIASVLKAAGAR
jgi:ankyrin repeat protein